MPLVEQKNSLAFGRISRSGPANFKMKLGASAATSTLLQISRKEKAETGCPLIRSADNSDFRTLVENSWRNNKIDGWGSFVLKEKLKSLKAEIKSWKNDNGTFLSKEVEEIEDMMTSLHLKLESAEWEEIDRE
ncbi:hypothetical protein ACS0TY_018383 [Phlomoides rotata]